MSYLYDRARGEGKEAFEQTAVKVIEEVDYQAKLDLLVEQLTVFSDEIAPWIEKYTERSDEDYTDMVTEINVAVLHFSAAAADPTFPDSAQRAFACIAEELEDLANMITRWKLPPIFVEEELGRLYASLTYIMSTYSSAKSAWEGFIQSLAPTIAKTTPWQNGVHRTAEVYEKGIWPLPWDIDTDPSNPPQGGY